MTAPLPSPVKVGPWRKVNHEWIRCDAEDIVRAVVHDITAKWHTETERGQEMQREITWPHLATTAAVDAAKAKADASLSRTGWLLVKDVGQ